MRDHQPQRIYTPISEDKRWQKGWHYRSVVYGSKECYNGCTPGGIYYIIRRWPSVPNKQTTHIRAKRPSVSPTRRVCWNAVQPHLCRYKRSSRALAPAGRKSPKMPAIFLFSIQSPTMSLTDRVLLGVLWMPCSRSLRLCFAWWVYRPDRCRVR